LTVYTFNPLKDPRWAELSERHPRASVFHTTGWLEALHRTYGYEPIVYTTSPPGATLTNGIVFCRISSWLTGRRMVSLPFADHCEPLVESHEQWKGVFGSLQRTLDGEKLKYIEIRPLSADLLSGISLQKSDSFCFHTLDLRTSREDLFRRTDKNSVQRRVRRAEREALGFEEGCSEMLLRKFYGLLVLTRKRHNLPPQPIEWFRNLITFLRDRLTIRVVSSRHEPIASILTFSHRDTYVYKYGCSDARYHNLGAMPLLLWRAIQTAKDRGMQVFDFGRSDTTNEGLIRFKDNWGTSRSTLSYGRICAEVRQEKGQEYLVNLTKHIFAYMPDGLITAAGRLLYRHIA
jgi:CelD/BcsL family acetyltransferase involved in cellulose biosynthesis